MSLVGFVLSVGLGSVVGACGVLEFGWKKRHDGDLAKHVPRNNGKRDADEETPFPGRKGNSTQEFAADYREDDLYDEDDGKDDNESAIVGNVVEDVDFGCADVEGIDTGDKDKEGEKCGEEGLFTGHSVSDEQRREVVVHQEYDRKGSDE